MEQPTTQISRIDQAIAQCESILARQPTDIATLNQLAMLKVSDSRFVEALGHMTTALKLAPYHQLLHYNQGKIYGGLHQYQEEIQAYERAITLKPDFTDAHVNMGVALRDQQHFDKAFTSFKQALRINPDHPGARTNRAQTNLMLGNFEHGWREYEWRWQDGQQQHGVTGRRWNGKTSIHGKRLLIHAEQGLGDTIQFVRYISLLQDFGATLILRIQKPLLELFSNYPGVASVIDEVNPVPEFDFHIPLLSLPNALYEQYPLIPTQTMSHFANPAKKEISSPDQPLRVGLCWKGNPRHINDGSRSVLLASLVSTLPKNCIFVSLQKEIDDTDRITLAMHPEIINTAHTLKSFADTAALVLSLDLVITVDTSVAHLCGALGVKTWVLLAEPADWRWMLNRSDSPWYPSMKLFRQQQRNNWEPALRLVSMELEQAIHSKKQM